MNTLSLTKRVFLLPSGWVLFHPRMKQCIKFSFYREQLLNNYLFCGVTWRKIFLIWLNRRISTPRQNRVSDGSRPRKGNLGRVKAVTSNRERTLRLSQSGLLFCTSVEAILPHKFFARTPQSTDFCF